MQRTILQAHTRQLFPVLESCRLFETRSCNYQRLLVREMSV